MPTIALEGAPTSVVDAARVIVPGIAAGQPLPDAVIRALRRGRGPRRAGGVHLHRRAAARGHWRAERPARHALHLVRRDFGAEVAADVARRAVMPLERAGGQAQFIVRELPRAAGRSLAPLLSWIEDHLDEPLGIDRLAGRAAMSPRSFGRHFSAQVGMSPARWIAQARVRRAQQLLESTALSIEQVAAATGFGSASVLRERFRALAGSSPVAYRRNYRAG